uniref:Carbohydrate sulfotransferase n=1 Tax=Rhabditophanes sp. KR3021 TaxID=114890 RepID=A0AC35TRD8_9BILA
MLLSYETKLSLESTEYLQQASYRSYKYFLNSDQIVECSDDKLRPCIPGSISFYPRYRVSSKYKINVCSIDKNLSTLMTAVICLLKNETFFMEKKMKLSKEEYHVRSCGRSIEETNLTKVSIKFNDNRSDLFEENGRWLNLVIIREPIERFVSGFVDKCVINQTWQKYPNRCGGCKMNLKCFVEYMYKRMIKRALLDEKINNFDDQHFNPQTWRCEDKFEKFTRLKYSADPALGKTFFDQLYVLLHLQNVSSSTIDYIKREINEGRTDHATYFSNKRLFYTRTLTTNPYLMDLISRMYYSDFKILNYTFPKYGRFV